MENEKRLPKVFFFDKEQKKRVQDTLLITRDFDGSVSFYFNKETDPEIYLYMIDCAGEYILEMDTREQPKIGSDSIQ